MTWIEDLRQAMREMPWFVAAVVLLIAMGVGINAEVLGAADGNETRLCLHRVDTLATPWISACERQARRCAMEITPGVTVLIGTDRYRLEVTIPEASVRSRLDTVRKLNLVRVAPFFRSVVSSRLRECRG